MKSHLHPLFIFSLLMLPAMIPMTTATSLSNNHKQLQNNDKNNNGTWGFIWKKDITFDYLEIIFKVPMNVWWGGPDFSYSVHGIGRHNIHWEIEYTIYTYSTRMPQPQVGVFQGNDTLYLFDFNQQPTIKLKAGGSQWFTFFFYKTGEYTGRFYIDNELIQETTINHTHQ